MRHQRCSKNAYLLHLHTSIAPPCYLGPIPELFIHRNQFNLQEKIAENRSSEGDLSLNLGKCSKTLQNGSSSLEFNHYPVVLSTSIRPKHSVTGDGAITCEWRVTKNKSKMISRIVTATSFQTIYSRHHHKGTNLHNLTSYQKHKQRTEQLFSNTSQQRFRTPMDTWTSYLKSKALIGHPDVCCKIYLLNAKFIT